MWIAMGSCISLIPTPASTFSSSRALEAQYHAERVANEDNILALPYHQGPGKPRHRRRMMMSRRSVVMSGLGWCACSACAAEGMGASANAARADGRVGEEQGPGYRLHFIGAQRETIMNGKLAAAID